MNKILTCAKVDAFKAIFDAIDKNKNGVISKDEFKEACK